MSGVWDNLSDMAISPLRQFLATVDPETLTVEDRIALLDLFRRAHEAELVLESSAKSAI